MWFPRRNIWFKRKQADDSRLQLVQETLWKTLWTQSLVLLIQAGVWQSSGAVPEWFQRSLLSAGQRGHMEGGPHPHRTGLSHQIGECYEEKEGVSTSFLCGAGFYKPLGRKWGRGLPLTCSHLLPRSLSQKQFKQLMEVGWSSSHLIPRHCDSYRSFLIIAPQA